ncbi:MAG TPA: hypothetical protein VGL09_11050 [Methylomirabilota bacterium]
MVFDAIAGQPRALALLRRALAAERVAHAYAFVGPPGSGRTTSALAFAAALVCEGGGCGTCRACTQVAGRQHPDVHVIVPTPPPSNPKGGRAIRIDAIRELERRAALRPAAARRKVFVLDDADRMTDDAPQAFLKTLEEPPAHTVIILVLARRQALPATVLSRCHVVPFAAREDTGAAAERAAALELLGEVRDKGPDALFRRLQTIDRARAEAFVDAYWLLYRDLLLVKAGAPGGLLVNGERADALVEEAGEWTEEALMQEIETCRAAREALTTNVSPRLTVEVVLSRLALRAA